MKGCSGSNSSESKDSEETHCECDMRVRRESKCAVSRAQRLLLKGLKVMEREGADAEATNANSKGSCYGRQSVWKGALYARWIKGRDAQLNESGRWGHSLWDGQSTNKRPETCGTRPLGKRKRRARTRVRFPDPDDS